MAPNSEEVSKRDGQFNFLDEIINKEKQRPPIYNPEDYAIMLKKWGKKSANGGLMSLYSNCSTSDIESNRSQSNSFRDYRNPMLTSSGSEMTLRQFGTVSELLAKLKTDLKLAFPSLTCRAHGWFFITLSDLTETVAASGSDEQFCDIIVPNFKRSQYVCGGPLGHPDVVGGILMEQTKFPIVRPTHERNKKPPAVPLFKDLKTYVRPLKD